MSAGPPAPPAWLAPLRQPDGTYDGVARGTNADMWREPYVCTAEDWSAATLDGDLTPAMLRELADFLDAMARRR